MLFLKEFEKLGLPTTEAKVYHALLAHGQLSASEIAKYTGLGRTNVYEYAISLERAGLVKQVEKNGKTQYAPESPNVLKEIAQLKMRQAKEVSSALAEALPKLEEMYNQSKNAPVVEHLNGRDARSKVFEVFANNMDAAELIYAVPNIDLFVAPEPKFATQIQRNNITTLLFTNDGNLINEYKLRDQREKRVTTQVNKSLLPITTDMIIYSHYLVFGKIFHNDPAMTMISDKNLAKFLTAALKKN